MPKKIMWFSRHDITPSELRELRRLYAPDVQIVKDPKPFSTADDVVRRYNISGADDLLVVAPLSVFAALCDRGIHPLYAKMRQVYPPERGEVNVNGRLFVFERFQRVKRVALEFEDI